MKLKKQLTNMKIETHYICMHQTYFIF